MCLADIDVAIFCGGKGTRIAEHLGDIPKVLAPVGDSTILDILIGHLRKYGAKRFVLSAGHLSEKLVKWAWARQQDGRDEEINVNIEAEQGGSGQALINIRYLLKSDPVLVVNGDTLTNANLCRFLDIYQRYGRETAMLWSHPYGRRDLQCAGYYLMSRRMLGKYQHLKFEMWMHKQCQGLGQVDIWRSHYLDIGTPKTLAMAPEFVELINAPEWIPDAARA